MGIFFGCFALCLQSIRGRTVQVQHHTLRSMGGLQDRDFHPDPVLLPCQSLTLVPDVTLAAEEIAVQCNTEPKRF
jgi:hypothetical protein